MQEKIENTGSLTFADFSQGADLTQIDGSLIVTGTITADTIVPGRINGKGLSFEAALQSVQHGGCEICRAGWNGKGMSVFLVDGGSFRINGLIQGDLEPHLVMKTADGKFVPWLASPTDLLATDWEIV